MSEVSRRIRPLSRQAFGMRLAGAMIIGVGAMAGFGCSNVAAESTDDGNPSTEAVQQEEKQAQEPTSTAFEYADGSDMYNHKSVQVTDAALIGEGAEFVNGLDAENTYIYKGYAHSDRAHYAMYSLYTELITNGDGLLTAINLTSGNDTWANKWGALGARPTINGVLPDGVTFEVQTTEEGENAVITPELTVEAGSEADAAGHAVSAVYLYNVADDLTTVGQDVEGRRGTTHNDYDVSITPEVTIVTADAEEDDDDDDDAQAAGGKGGASGEAAGGERGGKGEASGESAGGERGGKGGESAEGGHGGSAEGGERGGKGEAAAEAAPAEEGPVAEADGAIDTETYAYDGKTGAITVKNDSYNLVQVVYQLGTEVFFNEFVAIDDNPNATKYIEANFPDTDVDTVGGIEGTATTNRSKWTYSLLSLVQQRELASWGLTFEDTSLYTGNNDGEIGDIDTISGATKTSVPFQDALNQAVAAGYVTGVADYVTVTIDGGSASSDGIDASAVQQDQTTVVKNADGTYQVSVNFPAGIDESVGGNTTHAIGISQVDLYELGGEDLGTLGVWNLGKGTAGYTPVATYTDSSREAGDVSDSYITYVSDWDYPYNPTFTVNDPDVTHAVVTFTIGHSQLGIAYDLEAMAAACEVEAMIDAMDASDASAVQAARAAYDALITDVKGTVGNYSKLLEAEGK